MIAITGGGTGGHLMIAKAIKEELNRRGIKPIFIGSTNGQDRSWFENDEGFCEKIFLNTGGVVNKRGFAKLISLANIAKNGSICTSIIREKGIEKILSVGGYSAAPLVFASILTKTELFIHEQNAVIGKLNSLAKPFAKEFFSSFLESSKCKSYPVSKQFFDKAIIRDKIRNIIFLGGSQGASAINNLAITLAPTLQEMGIGIIHQTGNRDFERIKAKYAEISVSAEIFAFSNNIIEYVSRADFAISRAGASALFELTANAIPTFFIPYPFAAANHQELNAKYLVDKTLAFYSNEKSLNTDKILSIIKSDDIKTVSKNLKNFLSPNGAKCIVDAMLS